MMDMDVTRMVPGRIYRVAFRRRGEAFVLNDRYIGREISSHGDSVVFAESLPSSEGIPVESVIDVSEMPPR
jgi:hypothetical protein